MSSTERVYNHLVQQFEDDENRAVSRNEREAANYVLGQGHRVILVYPRPIRRIVADARGGTEAMREYFDLVVRQMPIDGDLTATQFQLIDFVREEVTKLTASPPVFAGKVGWESIEPGVDYAPEDRQKANPRPVVIARMFADSIEEVPFAVADGGPEIDPFPPTTVAFVGDIDIGGVSPSGNEIDFEYTNPE